MRLRFFACSCPCPQDMCDAHEALPHYAPVSGFWPLFVAIYCRTRGERAYSLM